MHFDGCFCDRRRLCLLVLILIAILVLVLLGSAQNFHHGVLLNWSAPSDAGCASITDYKIYRGTASGGPYTLIGDTGSGSTVSYLDQSAQHGYTYYYVVTAVNSCGEGIQSGEVNGQTNTIPPHQASTTGAGY